MNQNILKITFIFVIFCNIVVDISHKILLQNIAFKILDGSEQIVLISIINALILLPFLLFFSLSGYISDKYDKKKVLIYGAVSSFSLSILMFFAYSLSNFNLAMFVLFLLAIQSAIYSPAKFGLILNLYGKEKLSFGNSIVQATSMIAILLTMGVYSFIFEKIYQSGAYESIKNANELLYVFKDLTLSIIAIATIEMLLSWVILNRFKSDHIINNKLSFKKEKYFKGELLKQNLKLIFSNKVIYLSVLALSIFWGISQGLLAVFPSYAKEYLQITDVFVINGILASSGVGIGLGSYFYSKFSKNYIETGTIPLAAIGLSLSIYLSTQVESTTALMFCFLLFGICGGLFVVPLNALIQFNSKSKNLGTILAGNNWLQSLVMFSVLVITTLVALNNMDALGTIYLLLFFTVVAATITLIKLPQSLVYFFVKFIVGLKYKLEVTGMKNIPSQGGVLLLGNHVSWIDWAIIQMSVPREVKFVMDKTLYNKWYLKWFLRFFYVIPINANSSKSTIIEVSKCLDEGSVVVLFPEGAITRNGHLGEFKKGFELILKKTKADVPVVAFYIRGLWESMFSRANKKLVDSYRTNTVTVSFSYPMKKEIVKADFLKHKVMNLTITSWSEHIKILQSIPQEIFNRMKEVKNSLIVADSTGMELTGFKFLTVSILFKNLLKQRVKGQNIGLLVPSTAAGAFINTSVLMLGKTAVNLNYTAELESLIKAIKSADIKTIVASRKFLDRLVDRGIDLSPLFEHADFIYLEDLKEKISKAKGLLTLLSVKFFPVFLLKALHVKKVPITSDALIMFSSGSEGNPKGIKLSHMNILGNTQQIATVLNFNASDAIVGSLPLFHAFGICVTTFLPLIEGIKMVAHPDPTDGYEIGKLVNKYKATIMCGTSTFFRLYLMNKKIHPLMFESLRYVVGGAEKLSPKVREDFKKRFGKDIMEGYGTTETSPVASCNLPDILTPELQIQKGEKIGSVGMPLPGTSIKIVDPETFEPLDINEEGMVLIGGVQIMKGYLNDEAKTNSVIKTIDGKSWYVTGDKGRFDEDGFLYIVDRYSRFAKLAGEMISLGAIEAKLSKLITNVEIDFIATSIPDDKKGEKIVLLLTNISEEEIRDLKKLIIKEFDNKLMIPSDYKIVKEVPKLGSGKIDYGKTKKLVFNHSQKCKEGISLNLQF